MKKIIAMLLSLIMICSLATVAFAADDQDASFIKTYKITNEGTTSPEETFTFEFTAVNVTDSNKNLTVANMPDIDDSTVKFEQGDATAAGLEKSVAVALSKVNWPGVGIYYYTLAEKAGTTAGVTYDKSVANLKITVAYDEGTNTYYTAFVTMSLADENQDGQTDVKTGGFTNEYSAGELKISKKVTGNLGDKSAYFDVTVTLTGEEGLTYGESYAVSGGSHEENPDSITVGEATVFKLKHGETITIANLPYGVTYSVEESDYTTEDKGAYDEPFYQYVLKIGTTDIYADEGDNINGEEFTAEGYCVIDTASEAVLITNNKDTNVDTGIVLDSAPYIVMLVVAMVGVVALVSKKRYEV